MTKLPLAIELEKSCSDCRGRGYSRIASDSDETESCRYCNGTGRVPTDAGESLLLFIKRWSEKKGDS